MSLSEIHTGGILQQLAPLPQITAIVPFYGDPAPVIALVKSLTQETLPQLERIVISDDQSPTPFPTHSTTDERVHVIRRETNGGFGAAVNSALETVQTPLALVLNSDVEICAGQIRELLEFLRGWHPVVASPTVLDPDGSQQWTGRHFPTISHQVVEWLSPLARWRHRPLLHRAVGHDLKAAVAHDVTPVDWVTGAALVLPVQQVRNIGGFDESFYMNCEEVDLQKRLREHGVPSVVVPQVRVTHIGGASSDPEQRRTWLVDSRVRYAHKWGRPRMLTTCLQVATLINFLANLMRRVCGKNVQPVVVLRQELRLLR